MFRTIKRENDRSTDCPNNVGRSRLFSLNAVVNVCRQIDSSPIFVDDDLIGIIFCHTLEKKIHRTGSIPRLGSCSFSGR
jgi:hypothetical protein